MPYCEKCGTKISETANFCFKCGNSAAHKILKSNQGELFNNSNNRNLDDLLNGERKRKWTDEALLKEFQKYNSVEEFKKNNYNIWILFKKRDLVDKIIESENVQTSIPISDVDLSLKTKQISVLEYSKKINPKYFRDNRKYPNTPISRHSIFYRIKNNLPLPEVIKYDKVGKVHVLTVKADF